MNEWLGLQQWYTCNLEKSNLTFYTWRDQRPHKTKYKIKKKPVEEKLEDKLTKTN
jgi:hypothetical protein